MCVNDVHAVQASGSDWLSALAADVRSALSLWRSALARKKSIPSHPVSTIGINCCVKRCGTDSKIQSRQPVAAEAKRMRTYTSSALPWLDL